MNFFSFPTVLKNPYIFTTASCHNKLHLFCYLKNSRRGFLPPRSHHNYLCSFSHSNSWTCILQPVLLGGTCKTLTHSTHWDRPATVWKELQTAQKLVWSRSTLWNCALPAAPLPVQMRPKDSITNPQFPWEGKQGAAGLKEAATHSSRSVSHVVRERVCLCFTSHIYSELSKA